jgi:omega-6 fatty acid desaturase (delta-12 desaturase)
MPTEIEKWSPMQKTIYQVFLGSPLKLWASVGHWWIWHFDLAKYTEKQKPRVSVESYSFFPCCPVNMLCCSH